VLGRSPGEAELAGFDEVVIATGIDPRRPAIPGIDRPNVLSYVQVLANGAPVGERVAIIGMGGIGFDVALYLLERNSRAPLEAPAFERHWGIVHNATAPGGLDPAGPPAARAAHRITMMKRSQTPFGHTLGRSTGWVHRAELARNGVKMLKGVEYRRIDAGGVHVAHDGGEQLIAADTVVVCAGQEPRRELAALMEKLGKPARLIGGAREAGELDAKRAMLEGAELGATL
jgi:2,4-dienoyl-CoA reductase (NADPH2)